MKYDLMGILKFSRAKLKDGCRRLRSRLAEKGVVLPSGRRKTATTTVFTALCESGSSLNSLVRCSSPRFKTSALQRKQS